MPGGGGGKNSAKARRSRASFAGFVSGASRGMRRASAMTGRL